MDVSSGTVLPNIGEEDYSGIGSKRIQRYVDVSSKITQQQVVEMMSTSSTTTQAHSIHLIPIVSHSQINQTEFTRGYIIRRAILVHMQHKTVGFHIQHIEVSAKHH